MVRQRKGTHRELIAQARRYATYLGQVNVGFIGGEIVLREGFLIPAGETGSMTVLSDAPVGKYSYAMFCYDTNTFCECNSHPVMIIDPGP